MSSRSAIAYGTSWTQRAAVSLCFMDLYQSFCPSISTSLPHLPPVLTYALSSWEGWKFILHKQFVRWPLSESANQVANSDVDTCPFGTRMKTATYFLETIKHPVCEQQFSLNCNMGKTWMGHADRYLLIRSSKSFNVLEIHSFISLQYSEVWG